MLYNLDPFTLIVRGIVLLTSIPVHEAAHAFVADKLGDPTGRYAGRLTLNPIAHFDPMGAFAMVFIGIGWAKPVPINMNNFKDPKKGMAISAAAGPISNMILATISMIIAKILIYSFYLNGFTGTVANNLIEVFEMMCSINISLAIFNLIPIPPFDGSRIFNSILSDRLYYKIMQYERYIFIALLVVLYTGILTRPLGIASNRVFRGLNKMTGFVDRIFRMFY